jgi:hypothetical protein
MQPSKKERKNSWFAFLFWGKRLFSGSFVATTRSRPRSRTFKARLLSSTAISMRIVHQEYEHWERIARPTMTTTTIHQAFCSFMATYLAIIAANDHLCSFFFFFFL